MSGVEDSCIVSSDASDEEAGCYISIPKPVLPILAQQFDSCISKNIWVIS